MCVCHYVCVCVCARVCVCVCVCVPDLFGTALHFGTVALHGELAQRQGAVCTARAEDHNPDVVSDTLTKYSVFDKVLKKTGLKNQKTRRKSARVFCFVLSLSELLKFLSSANATSFLKTNP